MSEQEEWSEWHQHDGKGCPVPLGVVVNVALSCGCKPTHTIDAHDLTGSDWFVAEESGVCILCGAWEDAGTLTFTQYRIRRPKGRAVLDAVLADLTAPVEGVDA